MDVERIQKINKLALDLMRQGLASDRDDAVLQAEKIFRVKDGEYSSIRERMQAAEPQKESPASLALSPQTAAPTQPGGADLSTEKVKDILQQNSQFLVKKISEFQEQMQSMKKEMEELKAKLSQHNSHNGAGNVPVQSASRGSEVVSPPERPREQTQSSAAHPRSGNYKVEEVSIEKFFYMGNKR